MDVVAEVRNYTWVPSGEAIRTAEVYFVAAAGKAALEAITSGGVDIANWKLWVYPAIVAGAQAGWEFVKGTKIPATPAPAGPNPALGPSPQGPGV